MPQLGRFDNTFLTPLGLPAVGASCVVYREGATVNGNQSGTTPLTITCRHRGKIAAGDSVFINTITGTTYSVDSVTPTTVTISGFVGTLNVSNGDRITPANSLPTLYSDDQGGATTGNPLTTSALGRAQCWMNTGAYDFIVSGGGSTTTAFVGEVTVGESPAVVISGETDSSTAVVHIEDTYFSIATAGAKLKSWRNVGVEKASVDKDGTGVFPRIGPVSTTTTGGALRIIDGNMFQLTVAGVQAALDECEAVGGGTVMIPSAAGISVSSTSVKIGNRVRLCGHGAFASTATFVASASASVSAMVENKTQDGTQQYAYVEHISLNGNKGGGAVITRGLNFKSVYVGSRIKDVLVTACSGNGLVIDGGVGGIGAGQNFLDNIVVTSCNDHNILITGPVNQVYGFQIGSESVAAGKAQIKITNATADASFGHVLIGLNFEGVNASDGLWLDGCANVQVCGIADDGSGAALNLVKITGSVGGSDGAFAAGGHVIINANANLTTIIDDQVAGVTVGNSQGRFVRWYSSPVGSSTLDNSQMIGVQSQRQGFDLTAASTISPSDGNYFVIVGNTNIDNITNATRYRGKILTLEFTGTPTLNHNSGGTGNLRLVGSANVAMTAGDTIQLVSNGTLWRQCAPVVVI